MATPPTTATRENSTPRFGIFMALTALLAAGLETFARRDMGMRYYSFLSAAFGFVMMLFFLTLGGLLDTGMQGLLVGLFGERARSDTEPSIFGVQTLVMVIAYLILMAMHLGRQSLKFQAKVQPHSYYWGLSRVERLAPLVARLVNRISEPIIRLTSRFWIDKDDDLEPDDLFPLIKPDSYDAAAKMLVEPLVFFPLSFLLMSTGFGGIGFWLFFSAAAVWLHGWLAIRGARDQLLDLYDSQITGRYQGAVMRGQTYDQVSTTETLEPEDIPQPIHFKGIYPREPDPKAAAAAIAAQMRNGRETVQPTPSA